ncbi:MAG: UbiA family prenyltransferase [Chloroflexi bacterium]|nr:UbiA family prenyltransferase [Chloroflexota bacterium]
MLKLTHPLHLLLVALTYLLGASVPAYLGKSFMLAPFALGLAFALLMQASMSFLREVFRPHHEPIMDGETPQKKETLRKNLLSVSAGMMGASTVIAFVAHLNFSLTSPTILFLFSSLCLVLLYSIPPFHLVNRGFGELILAVHIAYVVPSIAFLFQTDETSSLLAALLLPLVALALACFLIQNFSTFPDDQKYERGTLLRYLGWERAVPLHHNLIAFAYVSFAIVPLFGFAFGLVAPAFLTLPFAIFQVIQFRAIANGFPPNWRLITFTALAVFGLTAYFLTLTFWLR